MKSLLLAMSLALTILPAQADSLTEQRDALLQNTVSSTQSLMENMRRLQDKNNEISKNLFGGGSTASFGSGAANTVGTSNNVSNISSGSSSKLTGGVSSVNYEAVINAALEKSPGVVEAQQLVAKYSAFTQRAWAFSKDAFNYMIPFRGFAPSRDAANLVLNEDVKFTSLSSAQYKQEQEIDNVHLQLMTAIMQIAMKTSGDPNLLVADYQNLSAITGDEQALKVREMFSQVQGQVDGPIWDVNTRQEKYRSLVRTAMERDTVVQDILTRVRKFKPGKASYTASRIIMPVLGALGMAPSFVGPAAKMALTAYVFSTGGSEDVKILKTLYLDKMLESRVNLLSEEAHMALEQYQWGIATKNSTLVSASKSLIDQMTGGTPIYE